MPLEVFGYVELAYGTPGDGEVLWIPALVLDAFTIGGDAVSDLLFGLAKHRSRRSLYARRGIPSDSSTLVARDFEDNRLFITTHGEGAFGHSHATFGEIERVPWDAHGVDPQASEWWTVFELARVMRGRLGITNDRLRVVAWATW